MLRVTVKYCILKEEFLKLEFEFSLVYVNLSDQNNHVLVYPVLERKKCLIMFPIQVTCLRRIEHEIMVTALALKSELK
jgi:uncharacterized membrane protein YagU involved in acid resistance